MSLCCPPYGDDELGLSLCFSLFLCLSSTFFSCAISLPSFSTSKSTFLVVFLKCTVYVIKLVCMYKFLFLRQIIFQSVHLCSVLCTYYTQRLSLSLSLCLCLSLSVFAIRDMSSSLGQWFSNWGPRPPGGPLDGTRGAANKL